MEIKEITIVKSNGERELFDSEKLRQSLQKAGASAEVALLIVKHIEKELVNGITTNAIYKHAFSVLAAKQKKASVRYSLRRSLLTLGPTGFPFERFIGEMFKKKGFSVLLDQMVRGKCVEHEMDIVAWNNEKLIMVEAKYHHEIAYKSDLKVALYVKARFDDLYATSLTYGNRSKLDEGWLITNTKFTEKAVRYAECSGVKLVGWNYPEVGNLHDLIEETGIHPVTCLTSLSESEKRTLLAQGMVLCESIRNEKAKLRSLGWSEELIEAAEAESNILCPAYKHQISNT